jgi:hypothetical protein
MGPKGLEEVAGMTTTMTTMKKWQDDYLTRMARVEEPVVRFTAKATSAVAEYVPTRPQWAFLEQVPTMTEFVDSQLKFRRRVVDEQAVFVHNLLKAMTPAKTKHVPTAPAKRVVKKASPARAGVKAA